MRVPNLHTAPKRHLIKIRTFLWKIDSYLKEYKFATRFEGLRLDQFLEILKSNKALNKFSTDQLKITFKHQKMHEKLVRKEFSKLTQFKGQKVCDKVMILHILCVRVIT